jgi:hypothetical protein
MFRFSKRLNQVWGLEGYSSFLSAAYELLGRFEFSVTTVLVVSRGDQVSFNTTVGGGVDVLLKDIN